MTIGGTDRILVAAGDSAERHRLVDYLREHGMPAVSASRRNDVMRQFAAAEPALVILDLQIDSGRGLDLIREIRSRSDVPVIIITDHSGEEIDPVLGLECGADDCLRRPFGLRELVARVRAILRRLPGPNASRRSLKCGSCTFAGWHLDRRSRRLTSPRGERVVLTKGEYALLLAFLRAPQRPLSRRHLLGATRPSEDIHDRSIDVQIFRLRRKLESDPETPRAIATEHGVGYVFALPVQELRCSVSGTRR